MPKPASVSRIPVSLEIGNAGSSRRTKRRIDSRPGRWKTRRSPIDPRTGSSVMLSAAPSPGRPGGAGLRLCAGPGGRPSRRRLAANPGAAGGWRTLRPEADRGPAPPRLAQDGSDRLAPGCRARRNDGLISTSSLVVGVAAAGSPRGDGARSPRSPAWSPARSRWPPASMSRSVHRPTPSAPIWPANGRSWPPPRTSSGRSSPRSTPAAASRPELAAQVAEQLMAHDALAAHARDELGLSEARARGRSRPRWRPPRHSPSAPRRRCPWPRRCPSRFSPRRRVDARCAPPRVLGGAAAHLVAPRCARARPASPSGAPWRSAPPRSSAACSERWSHPSRPERPRAASVTSAAGSRRRSRGPRARGRRRRGGRGRAPRGLVLRSGHQAIVPSTAADLAP